MAVRQDKVQISIAFLTDESKEYAKLVNENKRFIGDLKTAQKEGKDLGSVVRQMAKSGAEIAKIPLDRLAPTQLIDRARQLQQIIQLIPQSEPEYEQLSAELKTINDRLATIRNTAKGVADGVKGGPAAIQKQSGAFGGLANFAAKAGAAVGVVYAAIASVGGIVNATRETEKLFAVLKNALGGGENRALAVFAELQEFAATTPFALNEVVGAFTKLQQRNFNPTIEQLRTMGDIAAASGKSIDQFVEAILDAQTGEFERLKEFGVVAKKQGDDVNVTFRGQSETFKNTSENLNAYLLKLGQLPGIQGATAAVAATLDGSLSNLGDNFTRLFATIGSGGGVLKGIVDAFGSLVGKINEFFTVPLSDKLREQQTEFTALVGVLQNVNASEATRNQAIAELQAKYPDYIGKVNLQTASETELNGVLAKGNNLFAQRIFAQQKDEGLTKFAKDAQALQADLLAAEKKLQTAEQRTDTGFTFGLKKGQEVSKFKNVVSSYTQQLEFLRAEQENFVKEQDEFARRFNIFSAPTPDPVAEKAAAEGGAATNVKAEKEAREAQQKKNEEAAKAVTERRKKQIEVELKEVETVTLRREVVLEQARAKGEIEEERYQDGLLAIQRRKYEQQLEVYKKYRLYQTDEALKVQKQLLVIAKTEQEEVEKTRTQEFTRKIETVEVTTVSRTVALEQARGTGQIDEERYQDGILGIQRRKLEEQLEVYRAFGKEKEAEALKIQAALLATENKQVVRAGQKETTAALDVQDVGEEALQAALRSKFEAALLTEQDYELQRLELKRLALAEEIAILQASSVPQVEAIQKREEEKAKVEADIATKRIENEKRTEELRRQVQEAGIQATADVFSVSADLLAKDEASRKKNASTIKAFQTAQVIVQGIAEVQKIWGGAAALGPIAGPIVGAIQTAVAVGRTVVAVNKIQSTKFERGGPVRFKWLPGAVSHSIEEAGATAVQVLRPMQRASAKMGFFGGKRHSAGGTRGVFDDGTRIEVERDEAFVVVNRRNAPLLRALSAVNAHNGNGVPFFARGGVVKFEGGGSVSLNTNPLPLPSAQSSQQQSVQQLDRLSAVVMDFQQVVAAFPRTVRSQVVYQDVEDAGTLLDEVRDDAAI